MERGWKRKEGRAAVEGRKKSGRSGNNGGRRRIQKWERKETEERNGDGEKLTITLRASADPRGQYCCLHYWYRENQLSSLVSSLSFPSAIATIRDTLFRMILRARFHNCAPSQRSSKFSHAARTRESYPYIFSVPRNRYHRARHTIQCA